MTHHLGQRSLERIAPLHPDLKRVVNRAIELCEIDFTVLEGMRTLERQKQLVAAGASQTMRSRHLDGHAVDLGAWVGDEVRWDWPLYAKIAKAMKAAAAELALPIEWGGDWKSLRDGPHFQLPWKDYP